MFTRHHAVPPLASIIGRRLHELLDRGSEAAWGTSSSRPRSIMFPTCQGSSQTDWNGTARCLAVGENGSHDHQADPRFTVREPDFARHVGQTAPTVAIAGPTLKLPPGATGFNPPTGGQVDLRAFATVCHHAARAIDATVTGVTSADVTPSFHTVVITYAQGHIAVLRHTTLPFIAFARPQANGDVPATFVDHPDLAATITDLMDAQVLTVQQLQTPLTQVDMNALGPYELDQITYWQPTTVGELLFNFWD